MLISLAGVVAPFLLGAVLASVLYADGRFFLASVSRWQSVVYLGAAMSVTAFPVLARIIQERGIGGTALGTLTLVAGSVSDMIAWILLGVVLVSVDRSFDVVGFLASHAVFVAFVVGALLPRGTMTAVAQPSHRAHRIQCAGAGVLRVFRLLDATLAPVVG